MIAEFLNATLQFSDKGHLSQFIILGLQIVAPISIKPCVNREFSLPGIFKNRISLTFFFRSFPLKSNSNNLDITLSILPSITTTFLSNAIAQIAAAV